MTTDDTPDLARAVEALCDEAEQRQDRRLGPIEVGVGRLRAVLEAHRPDRATQPTAPDPLACPPDGGCSGCGNWPAYCVCPATQPTEVARPWRPEDGDTRCQECGHLYSPWFAPHEVWNANVGTADNPRGEGVILCASCFLARLARTQPTAEPRTVLLPIEDVHYPTTPVQCACGWRLPVVAGAGSWVTHIVAAAQSVMVEPDNHHNAALCPYCSPPAEPRTVETDERECPTCSWPSRETVGMVCQTCGTDCGPGPDPDAYQDEDGRVWMNLRKHPEGWPGAYDFDSDCTPLYLRVPARADDPTGGA